MGRKVHPIGFRLGVIQDWQARWYADSHYAEFLKEDLKLRNAIQTKYSDAAISLVEIERQAKEVSVTIHTARPGIVIGRGGQRVDELSRYLEKLIGKRVRLNIREIRQPELDATLVAKTIAEQIQRRIAYRRAIKQAIFRSLQAGAKGIRVSCSGRLGDAEIARRQTMHQGQVPLHTLRADIDYGVTEAKTTLGRIGVKVWIYKGEILPEPKAVEVEEAEIEPAASTAATEAGAPAEVRVIAKTEEPPTEAAVAPVVEVKEEEPAAPVAEVKEEEPAKPAAKKRVKATASAEPEEAKTEEPVTEAAAEVKEADKPAKPAAKKRVKATAGTKPEEAKTEEPVTEAAAEVKEEDKPAKPAAKKRVKTAASAKPEEAKAEEKPAKTSTRSKAKAASDESAAEATEKEA